MEAWKSRALLPEDVGYRDATEIAMEQPTSNSIIDDTPIWSRKPLQDAQRFERLLVDRRRTRKCSVLLQLKRRMGGHGMDRGQRVGGDGSNGEPFHSHPRRQSVALETAGFAVGKAGEAAEVPPLSTRKIRTVTHSQITSGGGGMVWMDRFSAEAYPSLVVPRAGFDHDAGSMLSLTHGR